MWEEGQVIKLFQPDASIDWIRGEAARSRLVYEGGLPVPWVGDILEVGGRTGIVYERLNGPSLNQTVRANLDAAKDILRRLAELHHSVHQHHLDGLPSQRASFQRSIEKAPMLTGGLRAKILRHLELLPDGDKVCHGDLNLDNVIVTTGGWKVIDWDNARSGNPLADVARVALMLDAAVNYAQSQVEREMLERIERPACDAYIQRYLELSGATAADIQAWRVPVAAARLNEGITEEEVWLLDVVRSL